MIGGQSNCPVWEANNEIIWTVTQPQKALQIIALPWTNKNQNSIDANFTSKFITRYFYDSIQIMKIEPGIQLIKGAHLY